MIAWAILGLFGQDEKCYPVENINFSYGHLYYFFARRKNWCVMCYAVVEGEGWQHPDQETQWCFEETANEFLAERYNEVTAVACSESCWREFMNLSFEHWNE